MRISRPPQARRCRQKLREDVERALTRFSGPALCVVLEGAIARFKAANVVAEVSASTFDKTYSAYEDYLARRRKGDPWWSFSGWLQHAGLSERFPDEEYVANKAHAIPGSFEQPTIPARTLPPTSVNLGNGTSELGPMQRKCLLGPGTFPVPLAGTTDEYDKHVRAFLNSHIQQVAHELERAEAVGRREIAGRRTGELGAGCVILKLADDVRLEVGYLLSAGRKLDAIKLIRERTPASLEAAIRYVDQVEEHWDMTPRRTTNSIFRLRPARR